MKVTPKTTDELEKDNDDFINNNHDQLVSTNAKSEVYNSPAVGTSPISCSPSTSKLFSVSEVAPCLVVCGAPALRWETLHQWGVSCVVNCAPELPPLPLPPSVQTCLRVPLPDSPTADILQYMHPVADTILKVDIQGGKTLVHCVAGVSRSASLCLGYLVKHRDMSLRQAFVHLRSCRPCIRPNVGFFRQMIQFEEQLTGRTSVAMVYNPAAGTIIPDVYEPDYHNTLSYHQTCLNRNYGTR